MPSFSNFTDFEKYLNQKINVAVEETCDRLLSELTKIIQEEFYLQYNPKVYERTYQYAMSGTYKMLTQLSGMVFLDADSMDYGAFWDGERQLAMAAEGYHGRYDIRTEGRPWQTFIEFCEKNAFKILKEEIIKQGIPLK